MVRERDRRQSGRADQRARRDDADLPERARDPGDEPPLDHQRDHAEEREHVADLRLAPPEALFREQRQRDLHGGHVEEGAEVENEHDDEAPFREDRPERGTRQARRGRFRPAAEESLRFARLGHQEERRRQIGHGHGRGAERGRPHPESTERRAERWPENEAEADARTEAAHALGAKLSAGDVRDGRLTRRDVARGRPGEHPGREEQRQERHLRGERE